MNYTSLTIRCRSQYLRQRNWVCAVLLAHLTLAWLLTAVPIAMGQVPRYAYSNFAGLPGGPGSNDGTQGSVAPPPPHFNYPAGAVFDPVSGAIYVADTGNHTIRKVTIAGVVTTFAGTAGSAGSLNGTGNAALFNNPQGVAVDSSGNVYVADTGNHTIRKITPAGAVTTLAGTPGISGSTDGTQGSGGVPPLFYLPSSVAVDSSGNVYVADTRNYTIRKITAAGVVTTIAGSVGNVGSTDSPTGPTTTARFNSPEGVAVDSSGHVYVADTGNHTIRKITLVGGLPTGVTTFAGTAGIPGSTAGLAGRAVGATTTAAGFPVGTTVINTLGSAGYGSINAGDSVTFAGDPNTYLVTTGTADVTGGGAGSSITLAAPGLLNAIPAGVTAITDSPAQFHSPQGVAVDSGANVYVADTGNQTIRQIVVGTGAVSTLAATAGVSGSADGTGGAAEFYHPDGLTVGVGGNVYVADTYNFTIRTVTSAGVVTTLAGTSGGTGIADGSGSAARFNDPQGVVVNTNGNTYVVDSGNYTIRQITPAGTVITFAGNAGIPGSADGNGTASSFSSPVGLGNDGAGNLYVADTGNHTIRVIDTTGAVTTFAGVAGNPGSRDGLSATASGTASGAFTSNVGYAIGATRIGTLNTGTGTINSGDLVTFAGDPNTYTVIGGTKAVQGGSAVGAKVPILTTAYPVGTTNIATTGGSGTINAGDYITISGDSGQYLVTTGTANVNAGSIQIAAPGLDISIMGGNSISVVGSSFVIAAPGLAKAIPQFNLAITLNSTARLNSPQGVAVDSAGNVYVADTGNNTIRLITPAGVVTTFSGTVGSAGSRDGVPVSLEGTATGAFTSSAGFAAGSTLIGTSGAAGSGTILPGDVITFSGDPNTYVVATGTANVRGGTAAGAMTTAAGFAVGTTFIATSGTSGTGSILAGSYVSFAGDPNQYLVTTGTADVTGGGSGTFIILASPGLKNAIPTSSTPITLVGSSITLAAPGLQQAIPASNTALTLVSAAQFNKPQSIAVDVSGNLYVADTGNNTIRKVTPAGVVTTLAGSAGSSGTQDGTGTAAQFKNPTGLALDTVGNLYVADTGNHTIRKITPAGVVTTIGGGPGILGSAPGTGIFARFYNPSGVALDSSNNIFVSDAHNNRISRGTLFQAFPKKGNTDMNNDGTDDLVFQNAAGQIYAWYMDGVGMPYTQGFLYGGSIIDWKIVGLADMNSDGNTDIVFQDTAGQIYVWYMNGSGSITSQGFLYGGGLGDWRIVGLADMNGDGNADIVFQNTVGQIYVWFMDGGGGINSQGYLYGGSLGDWRVVGAADLVGNGITDIVFQNNVGQIYVWYLDGSGGVNGDGINFTTGAGLKSLNPGVSNAFGYIYGGSLGDWRIVAIADLNGDGIADFVFQNTAGAIVVWYLDGSGGIDNAGISFTTGAGFKATNLTNPTNPTAPPAANGGLLRIR
jgi:sugar lactone lactonase YvrE